MRTKSRKRLPVKTETADPLLTVEESAGVLRVSPHTLDKWRTYGGGPRYTRVGRRIRYRSSDLSQFIDSRTQVSTSGNAA
jgi:predicted DNA-binding transcriptional regulator AlpA